MSFEITYFYHERKSDGGYNTEEKKEITKKVGKLYEDIPLEKLAKLILSQLVRRDIWVIDVELHEHVRKKIAFKEATDGAGIIIKGKKFTVDNTEGSVVENYIEEDVEDMEMSKITQEVVQTLTAKPLNIAVNPKRTLFNVLFTPELHHMVEIKNKKLTPNKKYAVHLQQENPLGGSFGMIYSITDDVGKLIQINEKYFTFPPQGLVGGREFNEDISRTDESKLLYQNSSATSYNIRSNQSIDRSQIPSEYAHIPIEGDDIVFDDSIPELRPKLR